MIKDFKFDRKNNCYAKEPRQYSSGVCQTFPK